MLITRHRTRRMITCPFKNLTVYITPSKAKVVEAHLFTASRRYHHESLGCAFVRSSAPVIQHQTTTNISKTIFSMLQIQHPFRASINCMKLSPMLHSQSQDGESWLQRYGGRVSAEWLHPNLLQVRMTNAHWPEFTKQKANEGQRKSSMVRCSA